MENSPVSPVATRTATSRSARSAMPTFAVIPKPSARALAYETTLPRMRQASASAAMYALPPSPAYQRTRPPKTAASPTRSSVESR